MKKQQSGFTLIELIMVIVILGILSAFALPRFANLTGQAEQAATEGALGAVRSAAAIAHAQWLADNANAASVSLEGTNIAMVNGYPSGDDADAANGTTICDAAQLGADFTCADNNADPAVVTITYTGGTCNFTYTEAAAGGSPGTTTVAGCP